MNTSDPNSPLPADNQSPHDNTPQPQQPIPIDAAVDDDVVLAELVPAPVPIWPAFAVAILAIISALAVSAVVMIVAAILTSSIRWPPSSDELSNWVNSLAESKTGLLVLVLPGQLTFAVVAIGAAALSREPILDRLGLRRGRLPIWSWPLFFLGTPVIALISSQLISLFVTKPSEQVKMFEQMFQYHSAGSFLLLLGLVSLLPGLVEEMLFRGFMQRRLLARLPAVTSIGICSVFFAAAHMDPTHAAAVLPLGIWLGIVAWRADSIWPSIFAHIGNNAYAIIISAMMGPVDDVTHASPWLLGVLAITVVSFGMAVTVLTGSERQRAVAAAIPTTDPTRSVTGNLHEGYRNEQP